MVYLFFPMQTEEYTAYAERERTYFWNVGRREILCEALIRHKAVKHREHVLDVGCGPGGNMLLLEDFGQVTGLDFSPEAVRFAQQYPFAALHTGDAASLPFPDASFSLVSCLDVLEHIEADTTAISEAYRVLQPGGLYLVTVPAYQWLWTDHDLVNQHVRRYTRQEITARIAAAGFRIEEQTHFVVLGIVLHAFMKCKKALFAKKNAPPSTANLDFPSLINRCLLGLLRCEKWWLRWLPIPFGTSILVIARKPQASSTHARFCATYIAPGGDVLDVGSGKGAFITAMAAMGYRAYGVEVNPAYIQLTKERAAKEGVTVVVQEGKGERIPFADAAVSFVNCAEVTEHVEDPLALCREMHRVLRAGGKGYVSFHNRFGMYDYHYHLWGINWLPRSWAERVLALLHKQKQDGAAGRQTLQHMHYYTYRDAVALLNAAGFRVSDIREEKIRARFPVWGGVLGFVYRVFLRRWYFNSFHLLITKEA